MAAISESGRFWLAALRAGSVGFVAWHSSFWLIALTVFVPMLILNQTSRRRAAAVAASYFGIASWPLVETANGFIGCSPLSPVPFLLWSVATALLSLPWVLTWTAHRHQLHWRVMVALVASVVPPLGLIGWASPLTASGVLFPGTAWFGILGTSVLVGAVAASRRRLLVAAVAVTATLVANSAYEAPPEPHGWTAIDTSFTNRGRLDATADFLRGEAIQRTAIDSGSTVTVFPEAVVSRWNQATEAFWEPTLLRLAHTGKTAVFGASLPISGTHEYRNAAVIVGAAGDKVFHQRVPVPLAMWKPFGPKNGVPLRLTGPEAIEIAGERVAFLICYEQLLVWPFLQSAAERPTLIVGMANHYWVRNTSIPAAQRASMKAWARLFALPLLMAENK